MQTEILWYYLYFHAAFKGCPKYKAYLYVGNKLEEFLEGNVIEEMIDQLKLKAEELGCPAPQISETKCP